MKERTRVLLLEDNTIVAARFGAIISAWPRGQLLATCHCLAEALEHIASNSVDLLVADLRLPDGSGIEAIRMLSQRSPSSNSIVISALAERPLVMEAIKAGATGYLLKDDDRLDIIAGIEDVVAGNSPISMAIAKYLIDLVREPTPPEMPSTSTSLLTERETEILSALAKGFTYREIARILGISTNTVPVHARNIYRKLQATNRSEATFEARRLGILGH